MNSAIYKYVLCCSALVTVFVYIKVMVCVDSLNKNVTRVAWEGSGKHEANNLSGVNKLFLPQGYNLLPHSPCAKDTEVLVAAVSHVSSRWIRDKIRDCWKKNNISNHCYWRMCINHTQCDITRLKLVFITGLSPHGDEKVQKRLDKEHLEFGDIVQGTFSDTYRNLVHKTLLLLNYAVNFCPFAKFVQKIDDNVRLNMNVVMEILHTTPDRVQGFVLGSVYEKPPVFRHGRWRVPESDFKQDYYPAHVFGPSYVISQRATGVLLEAAKREHLVYVEDAFITGISRNRTDVLLIDNKAFCEKKRKNVTCATSHNEHKRFLQ